MALLLLLIFSSGFLYTNSASVEENKEVVISNLIQKLEIRQCIRIGKIPETNLILLKRFSNENIPTVFMDEDQFVGYISNGVSAYWSIGIIIEVKTLDVIRDLFNMLKKAGEENRVEKFTWLVLLEEGTESEITDNKLDVPYDCKFLIIYLNQENFYDLVEVYKVKDVNYLFKFGTWDNHFGLRTTELSFYDRRSDLSNVTVTYATFMLGDNVCQSLSIACAKREIFLDMQKVLKFRIEKIRKTRPRSDGDDYADIYDSLTVFHSYFYRFEIFAPLFKTYLNWYIREPAFDVEPEFFIYPFAADLWFFIFLTIIIGSLAVVIIGGINRHLEKKSSLPQFVDDIFTTLECFCSQDGGGNRKCSSLRVLLIAILLNALFLIPAYSAFITSYLAVRIPRLPFHNLEEFIKNGEYSLSRNDDTPFPDLYFKLSTDPVVQVLYKKFLKVHPQEEGLRRTCVEKYSILLPNIYYEEANCTFYQMKTPITYFFLGLALRKGSVFRNVLFHYLIRSYTSGIINKLQKWINEKPIEAIKDDDEGFSPININQMSRIFMFIPIGVAIGVVFFSLEMLMKNKEELRIKGKNRMENFNVPP